MTTNDNRLQNQKLTRLSFKDLTLETERLRLTPLSLADVDLTRALWTDRDVMKYIADLTPDDEILDETRKVSQRGAGGRIGIWCISDRVDNEKLGTAILLPVPVESEKRDWGSIDEQSYPNAEIEIGYMFKSNAWGKGIATEACTRLLRFGFEATELEEIVATTDPENLASQKVLLKCGLRNEGLRQAYGTKLPGFRITRKEWASLNKAAAD